MAYPITINQNQWFDINNYEIESTIKIFPTARNYNLFFTELGNAVLQNLQIKYPLIFNKYPLIPVKKRTVLYWFKNKHFKLIKSYYSISYVNTSASAKNSSTFSVPHNSQELNIDRNLRKTPYKFWFTAQGGQQDRYAKRISSIVFRIPKLLTPTYIFNTDFQPQQKANKKQKFEVLFNRTIKSILNLCAQRNIQTDCITIINSLLAPNALITPSDLKLSRNQLKILQITAKNSPSELLSYYIKHQTHTQTPFNIIQQFNLSLQQLIQLVSQKFLIKNLPPEMETRFNDIKNHFNFDTFFDRYAQNFCDQIVKQKIIDFFSDNMGIKNPTLPFPLHSLPKEYQNDPQVIEKFFENLSVIHIKVENPSKIHIHWVLNHSIDNTFSGTFQNIEPAMPDNLNGLQNVYNRRNLLNKQYLNHINSVIGIDPGSKVKLALAGSHLTNPIYSEGGRLKTTVIQSRKNIGNLQQKRDKCIAAVIRKFFTFNPLLTTICSVLNITPTDLMSANYSKAHQYHRKIKEILSATNNTFPIYAALMSIQQFLSKVLKIYSKQIDAALENLENKKMTQCQQIAARIGQLINITQPNNTNNQYPMILFGNMSETKQGSRIRWNQKKNFVQFPHYRIYDYLRWYGYRYNIGVFLADEAWTSKAAYFQIFPKTKDSRLPIITIRNPQEWIWIKKHLISKIEIGQTSFVPANPQFDYYYEKYCKYLSDAAGAFNIIRKYCDILSLNRSLINTNIKIYLNPTNTNLKFDSSFMTQNQNQIAFYPMLKLKNFYRLNLCK